MNKKQKENLAKILINVGSIVFAGVVLSYFISENKITTTNFILGNLFMSACYYFAINIEK